MDWGLSREGHLLMKGRLDKLAITGNRGDLEIGKKNVDDLMLGYRKLFEDKDVRDDNYVNAKS